MISGSAASPPTRQPQSLSRPLQFGVAFPKMSAVTDTIEQRIKNKIFPAERSVVPATGITSERPADGNTARRQHHQHRTREQP
jgi:hypothetical protein